MAVMMIDTKGLLEGKRLRKLGLKARLYYPLLLGLANTFARLELDYDLLTSRFVTFHDPDTAKIEEWFHEYADAKLVLIYDGHNAGAEEPTRWAQFDTPAEYRRSYASKEEQASPAPPEPLYTEWLKAIHGGDWGKFHLTKYQQERQFDLSTKRSEAGRKGGIASGESRRSKQNEAARSNGKQTNRDDDGDAGAGADEDVEIDVDVEHGYDALLHHAKAACTNASLLPNGHNGQDETGGNPETEGKTEASRPTNTGYSRPAPPLPDGETSADYAAWFAELYYILMQDNPYADLSRVPKNWKTAWAEDFATMLAMGEDKTLDPVLESICFSQLPAQQKYYRRPAALLKNCATIIYPNIQKLKKAKAWAPIYDSFIEWINSSQPKDEGPCDDEPANSASAQETAVPHT